MFAGKGSDIRHAKLATCTADGIETLEDSALYNMLLAVFDDAVELIQALGMSGSKDRYPLRNPADRFPSAASHPQTSLPQWHDSPSAPPVRAPQHARSSENNDLRIRIVDILLLDAALQLEHHRTGSIDDSMLFRSARA